MTLTEAITIVVEALFAIVFVGSLIDFARRRDPVSRDVALAFSPFASLLVLTVWRAVAGAPPTPIAAVLGLLFFGQPLFVLHLVSLIRPVPRRILVGAVAFLAGSVVAAFLLRTTPLAAIAPLAAFTGIELLAAGYLVIEARRRRGPGGRRLAIAAAATVGLALGLLLTSGRAIGPGIGDAVVTVALALAVLAGFGYIVAFMPPTVLRRVWQASATVGYQRDLLDRAGASVDEIWDGYVRLATAMSGAPCAVVQRRKDGRVEVLASSLAGEPGGVGDGRVLDGPTNDMIVRFHVPVESIEAGDPVRQVADALGGRYVSVIDVGADRWAQRALIMASAYRNLFHGSDLDVLAALGTQTGIVAERRAMLADQEALSTRLSDSVEALRAASRAKSDFLASMSHELRTPLSAILGFSDLIRQEARGADEVTVPLEWIDHIHRGGEHLLALVNDVLDLAKVEAGRMELHPEAFDLASAVTELVNGVRPLADRKDLIVEADLPSMTVVADRGRLRQVLYNLVSNAIKFTPAGGRIRITAAEDADGFSFAVADTGVGIAPDDLESIFDEFRQVGATEEREGGTGLGLALAQRLVGAHGGRLDVASTVGQGTTFTVTMPRMAATRAASVHPGPGTVTAGDPAAGRDILVIEDDPSAERLLRQYLEPLGYQVRCAVDGEKGLAMAREQRPVAILLDVLVPRVDGWEVLRRLKADAALRDVPVVMVTVVDERDVGLALGAVDYLVKPVQREALVSCLARLGLDVAPDGRAATVLTVDDEMASLDLIGGILSSSGMDVLRASSGREAIEIVREQEVDLVICDLLMPDLDGFGVVAELKSDARTAAIPILICTAHDLTADEKTRLHGQILGIVTKGPFARDGLRGWLAQIRLDPGRAGA